MILKLLRLLLDKVIGIHPDKERSKEFILDLASSAAEGLSRGAVNELMDKHGID